MAHVPRNPWKKVREIIACALITLVVAAILFPAFATSDRHPYRSACVSNMKQAALGVMMYQTDFDDRLPPASRWADVTGPYIKNKDTYICPELRKKKIGGYGHAYRRDVANRLTASFQDPTVEPILFDSNDLRWNANGGYRLLPLSGRHENGTNSIAFLDGRVRSMTIQTLYETLRTANNATGP